MPYDKRVIEFPWSHIPKVIETLPLGHFKIPFMDKTRDIALSIRALVQAYGGTSAIESKICSYIFPLYCSSNRLNVPNYRISLINDTV